MSAYSNIEINEIIFKSLEGEISEEENRILNNFVSKHENADYYYNSLRLHVALKNRAALLADKNGKQTACLGLKELAFYEKIASAAELPEEKLEAIQKIVYPRTEGRKVSSFQIVTFIISAAAIIFFVLFLQFVPVKQYTVDVATLVDQIDVKWTDLNINFKNGDRLLTNQMPVGIDRGIIKIKYDEGVDVLIEGPAKYVVERTGIYLEYGRLFSRVSDSGLGFSVETSASRFVDMGTEFAVQAELDGSAELHVLKGKVQLFAGSGGNAKFSRMLTEKEAMRYDANTGKTKNVPIRTGVFVQSINSTFNLIWRGQKSLDLADIVGGGNGFGTGKQDYGIVIETGKPSLGPLTITGYGIKSEKTWDSFCPIPQIPVIDGIFIPDGKAGSSIVSSSGHVFRECPDTNGCWSGPITNGAKTIDGDYIPIVDEVAYGTPSNPALFMHGNIGITYDLNKIRAILPSDQSIGCFTSVVLTPKSSKDTTLDVWVLVDGQVRFSKTSIDSPVPFHINVPLAPQEQFLSLVVTDGMDKKEIDKNKNVFNWCFFCRPELVFEMK